MVITSRLLQYFQQFHCYELSQYVLNVYTQTVNLLRSDTSMWITLMPA